MTIPYQVRVGGLMRCCLSSLDEEMNATTKVPAEGDTLKCHYCTGHMRFRDGMWEWDRERDLREAAMR